MHRCLELAVRGAGLASPNPMVGAVLVGSDGRLLGEGWHTRYGAEHAERNAVRDAEKRSVGDLSQAALYVNLEPCSHYGKTPPCTDLILEKGIPRVVVGMVDPFPAVAGSGIARLRDHGVDVRVGVLEKECARLNEAFTHHVRTGRPLVTLKAAQTLDGYVATTTGDSRWISSSDSRQLVHHWRSTLDGILIGSGTARRDNPALTVRHVEGRQPVRIVLDREGSLPSSLHIFTDAFVPDTIAVVGASAQPPYAAAFSHAGGRLIEIPLINGRLDLRALLAWLGNQGGDNGLPMQSLLVEAGPSLATALLEQDLADRYFLFIAPKLIGAGVPVFHSLGIERLADALVFSETHWKTVGNDMLFQGYRRSV